MSIISPRLFPRSMFDWNLWNMPSTSTLSLGAEPFATPALSTLDIFDPFDELDRMMSRNLQWLTQPEFLKTLVPEAPRFPEKHRITIDCSGFDAKSIKTEIKDNKLVVTGREGARHETEDFSVKEFRKTYDLPKDLDLEKMLSFVTADGQLVIEFPIRREEKWRGDFLPRVVDAEGGGKRVELNVEVPENIDPSKIVVTCKDRDLIVKADYKDRVGDKVSRVHYYRRCTLPDNTDFDQLKCVYDANKLSVTAPLNLEMKHRKKVPVEIRGAEKEQQQQQKEVCPTCGPRGEQQKPAETQGAGQQQQPSGAQPEQEQQQQQPPVKEESQMSGGAKEEAQQQEETQAGAEGVGEQISGVAPPVNISEAEKTGEEQQQLSGEGGGEKEIPTNEEAGLPSQLETERAQSTTSGEQQKSGNATGIQSFAEGGKQQQEEQTR